VSDLALACVLKALGSIPSTQIKKERNANLKACVASDEAFLSFQVSSGQSKSTKGHKKKHDSENKEGGWKLLRASVFMAALQQKACMSPLTSVQADSLS
jgi:hypothetical protein